MAENIKYLCDGLGQRAYDLGIQKPSIAKYISDNLKYEFFDWQNQLLKIY